MKKILLILILYIFIQGGVLAQEHTFKDKFIDASIKVKDVVEMIIIVPVAIITAPIWFPFMAVAFKDG